MVSSVDSVSLRGACNESVVTDGISKWPEPVAVQGCTHSDPIGEDQSGRSVPGFGEASLVAIEIANLVFDILERFPSSGHQHRDDVTYVPSLGRQQFDDVV